jgi:hypothetical protein
MLQGVLALLLLCCGAAGTAHAPSIYKCVAADGRLAFRDTPCATDARQTKLNMTGLPLMDPDAPRHTVATRTPRSPAHHRTRRASASKHEHKQAMSWECRAADGEVFYRHTRCPGSVPGDGVGSMAGRRRLVLRQADASPPQRLGLGIGARRGDPARRGLPAHPFRRRRGARRAPA